jgi:hypothetical protein
MHVLDVQSSFITLTVRELADESKFWQVLFSPIYVFVGQRFHRNWPKRTIDPNYETRGEFVDQAMSRVRNMKKGRSSWFNMNMVDLALNLEEVFAHKHRQVRQQSQQTLQLFTEKISAYPVQSVK